MDAFELGKLADEYHRLKQERLALDKQAEKAKEKESEASAKLMAAMQESKLKSIGGATCTVNRHTKIKPRVFDWPALWTHIQKTGEFDLLHRRVTDKAVTDRWEEGEQVPGVDQLRFDVLSITDKE